MQVDRLKTEGKSLKAKGCENLPLAFPSKTHYAFTFSLQSIHLSMIYSITL